MNAIKNFNKAMLPKFNKSLYFEGLRQLRIGGIALAVLVALGTAREYLGTISFNTERGFPLHYALAQEIDTLFSGPAWLVFILCSMFAVISAFVLTTFTRSTKARDFYYATPHSGGTLWLNFAAACLTWIAAGAGSFLLVSCLFLMPFDAKIFGVCLFIACNVLAAVFMVFGMAMLAVSLTGRLINALVNLLALSALSTCVKIAFSAGYNVVYSGFRLVVPSSELYEYDPVFHIYERVFFDYGGSSLIEFNAEFGIFASWSTVGYCLLWGCVMLAAAAFFMTIRTGDSVGKPFVNGAAHAISLTTDYFPVSVVVAVILREVTLSLHWNGIVIDGQSIINGVLYLLIIFGCCWGLELLLTFDWKHSHRSFRLLPIPIVLALAIMTVGFLEINAEFNTTPAADEVESFTLTRNDSLPDELVMFRLRDTLGRWVTDEAEIRDSAIIEYATAQLKELSDEYGHDFDKAYNGRYSLLEYDDAPKRKDERLISIRLNLKNGKSITRLIGFDEEHIKALQNAFLSDSEFMKEFLSLPAADQVNAVVDEAYGLTGEETKEIYKTFLTEYNALSDEEKLAFMREAMELSSRMNAEEDIDAEEAPAETVTPTDISLISQSKEVGQYGITMSYLTENNENYDPSLRISINGYPTGHLYEYAKRYDYSLCVSSKSFPKTIALIVRSCNAKFTDAQKQFKASAESEKNMDYRMIDLAVTYITKDKTLDVEYVMLIGTKPEEDILNYKGKKKEQLDYYDEYDSDDEPDPIIREIEVDSDAMVRRLFEDIQTTETIDFTKPYADIGWYKKVDGDFKQFTFFAQTDFPSVAE